MDPTESDGLTESVTEESAEESPVVQDQPVRRIMKGLKKYNSMVRKLKSRVNDKRVNPKVVKSKATAVVMSLAKVSRPNEDGQGVFFFLRHQYCGGFRFHNLRVDRFVIYYAHELSRNRLVLLQLFRGSFMPRTAAGRRRIRCHRCC